MTREYNERNKSVLEDLTGSGIIRRQDKEMENQKITDFKTALQETKDMTMSIAQNETTSYKTLDDLLNEELQ